MLDYQALEETLTQLMKEKERAAECVRSTSVDLKKAHAVAEDIRATAEFEVARTTKKATLAHTKALEMHRRIGTLVENLSVLLHNAQDTEA
jgi:hypothetical protein